MKIPQIAIFFASVYGANAQTGCDGTEAEKWYPSGNAGDWSNGYCKFERQCNGQFGSGYADELACCKGFFGGQMSGTCLSNLAAPPTTSPTLSGGLAAFWYPDYDSAWPDAGCLNTLPLPYANANDRPTYSTQLECCKGAYGGQSSGKCLSQIASPPTTSPTLSGGMAGFWYPDYESAWSDAGCKNEMPLPFNKGDRPEYATQLECCKAAYGGQTSGKCLSELASPPTTSPTMAGGVGLEWYPDYTTAWSDAGCKNDVPLPFSPNSRPVYATQLECCKAAYGGQSSGKCLSELASPPTTSPTMAGGVGLLWYPDYSTAWSDAGCKNEVPLPFSENSRPTYDTQLECCKAAYGGQSSGKCLSELASPPTTSPTMAGGVGLEWYPDYSSSWADAGCLNTLPKPFNDGDRPVYATQLECCKAAYGGQSSGKCLSELASPPTTSPTSSGGADVYYPNYSVSWADATCINDYPVPSGRPTYTTESACCSGAYGGQTSQKCACAVDPCYSCKCGSVAELTANGCTAMAANCSR